MRSSTCTLRSFEKPDLTAEQWAEHDRACREWEARQEAERVRARLDASGIPPAYRSADVADCPPEVRAWAESPTAGLLLQGGFGTGKTHAACAALIALAPTRSVRFTTVDRMLRERRDSFSGAEAEGSVAGRFLNAGALCLDDLGKERQTEWGIAALFEVVDARLSRGLPTIVTTNYAGRELLARMSAGGDATTAKAIVSRMAGYDRAVLAGGDRRIRKEAVG